jgi:hypothetical protein
VSGLLEAALAEVERGFEVVALAPRTKVPHTVFAEHGVYSATSDPTQVTEIWTAEPDANVGIALGHYAGRYVFAVDLDDERGGSESFTGLLTRPGMRFPLTRTTETPRGWHFIYAAPVPVPSTRDRLGSGIETRCVGQYVVVPPSVHPGGGVYASAGTDTVAACPDWLLDLLLTASPTKTPPEDSTALDPLDLVGWARDPAFINELPQPFGICVNRRFNPPWRESSSHPCEIYLDKLGREIYVCQDFGGELSSLTIPEVYAACATRVSKELSPKEQTNWMKRGLAQTGRLELPPLDNPFIPASLSELEKQVLDGFFLRWQLCDGEEAIAFSCRFAPHWICQPTLSHAVIARVIKRLRALGAIRKVQERPTNHPQAMPLYVPGDGTPDPALREHLRESAAFAGSTGQSIPLNGGMMLFAPVPYIDRDTTITPSLGVGVVNYPDADRDARCREGSSR